MEWIGGITLLLAIIAMLPKIERAFSEEWAFIASTIEPYEKSGIGFMLGCYAGGAAQAQGMPGRWAIMAAGIGAGFYILSITMRRVKRYNSEKDAAGG